MRQLNLFESENDFGKYRYGCFVKNLQFSVAFQKVSFCIAKGHITTPNIVCKTFCFTILKALYTI